MTDQNTKEDAWRDLVQKAGQYKPNVGETTKRMITRMNELSPFASATGIFENGCGGGSLTTYIIDTYGSSLGDSNTRLLAGDFSPSMLSKLEDTKTSRLESLNSGDAAAAATHRAWSKLEIHHLDAHDLRPVVPDAGSISHVTAGHLYFLLDDPRKALRETHRILVPRTGVIGISSGSPHSQHIHALQNAVETVRPGTNLRMIKEAWSSEELIRGELEATGFVDVETFFVAAEMPYESHAGMAGMLLAMPVMKEVVEGWSEEEKGRLLEVVVGELRKANAREPGVLRGGSIVAVARAG